MSAFGEVLNEIAELEYKKAQDYSSPDDRFAAVRGSEDFDVPAWVNSVVRANDKLTRIKSLRRKGTLANESLRDALVDGAIYMLIAVCLLDEESESADRGTAEAAGANRPLERATEATTPEPRRNNLYPLSAAPGSLGGNGVRLESHLGGAVVHATGGGE